MATADYTHSPTPEDIMEYLDGEGTLASRTGIEAHLAQCEGCRVLASEQRRLSDEVGAWRVEGAPASLRAPALPRTGIRAIRFPASPKLRLTLVAAASVAAVLVTSVMFAPLREAVSVGEVGLNRPLAAGSASAPELSRAGDTRSIDSFLTPAKPAGAPASQASGRGAAPAPQLEAVRRPAIVRTATLRIVTNEFNGIRAAVEGIVAAAGGFVDQMTATGDPGSVRALRGTLRVPSDRLADVADRLRRLGQVVEDTQGAEDVADQLVDLDARLRSARVTERRLTELLRTLTGTLSDVLDVERELARVRIDIEHLDAENANIGRRVSYATVQIAIEEERKAGLIQGPLSFASRIRIAAADGLESALESISWTLLSLLRAGPFLTLWTVVLGTAWLILRRTLGSRVRDPQ